MFNPVLWAIDHMDGFSFEKLCTALMHRCGYTDIVPVGGTHDRGRDAEAIRYNGAGEKHVILFQFSLNRQWQKKLDAEIKKVRDNQRELTRFVFVTSQTVSGATRDKYTQMLEAIGWEFQIYDREWLRLQLEEVHSDLAKKYLAVPDHLLQHKGKVMPPIIPKRNQEKESWYLYEKQDYEGAALEFKRWLKEHDDDTEAWQALAWCQYRMYQYKEALFAINRTLAIDAHDFQSKSIKGCILAEDGIATGNRANLLSAKHLFAEISAESKNWFDYYNYGNVLCALDETEEALVQFRIALRLDECQPEVWKNLGSIYYTLGNHEEEIRCYDRALALDGQLSEALISKGVTLLQVFNKASRAVELIEKGLSVDPYMGLRWPHVWYWLSLGYWRRNKREEALQKVNKGLAVAAAQEGLLELKASLLAELWRKKPEYIQPAILFFEFMLEYTEGEPRFARQLVELHATNQHEEKAWAYIDRYFDTSTEKASSMLKESGISVLDCAKSLSYLQSYTSFRKRKSIEQYGVELGGGVLFRQKPFVEFLSVIFCISFGLGCEVLHTNGNQPSQVKGMFAVVRKTLERQIPNA